jgi:hypothetical protein
MFEFMTGVCCSVVLNILVTAYLVNWGMNRMLEVLRTKVAGSNHELATATTERAPREAKQGPVAVAPYARRAPRVAMREASGGRVAATTRLGTGTGRMENRELLRSALLSLDWKATQVDKSIAWLGARVEREALPVLIKDAIGYLAP